MLAFAPQKPIATKLGPITANSTREGRGGENYVEHSLKKLRQCNDDDDDDDDDDHEENDDDDDDDAI